ncbi:hypothetical protein SpCBS45565_g06500 [Spizellomyces sp. 'palustris']|nr:hypothetical protein SpCBS45565_g06500 [Spizellomyces sp. 'palustris']
MAPIPLPPPSSRLGTLQTLRSAIHKASTGVELLRPITPSISSRRQKLLTHYPPGVDSTKLASQDPSLGTLQLVDVWQQMKVAREEEMTKRGKPPRVSGKAKPPQADGTKKGKKRK